ncbi:hypothetical protein EUZ85_15595 [Hahella sp. KA22]|uniref:hypothetical protein n=1 Tax=Hahella sp. KA22 TaxID=1628392 RepID=UPI000FDE496B|nr:hypothetical protein [Hahella sp. KA22]AZZ92071.1 hypothetical protein ENC22_13030 [Hahella sp. KA22]QAY55442.1 hypothetical protein EUZ85_15595 [Hahella sp. KA22]
MTKANVYLSILSRLRVVIAVGFTCLALVTAAHSINALLFDESIGAAKSIGSNLLLTEGLLILSALFASNARSVVARPVFYALTLPALLVGVPLLLTLIVSAAGAYL